jgi:hypothetical protein
MVESQTQIAHFRLQHYLQANAIGSQKSAIAKALFKTFVII